MDGLSPRLLDTLRQLGLTEYGARCYVALLSLKSAEAAAIAEAAEVPRTKVYSTLKDLADAGWILATGGRPVVYRPAAPEERIHAAEKRIAEDADAAARELQARFALGAQMMPVAMYMIRGRAAIDEKTTELIARAREDLLVNLGFAFEGEIPALARAVHEARRRGVRVRVLVPPGVDARAFGGDARAAIFPFRGIICDWRQALLALPQSGDDPVALWNPSAAFIEMLRPMLSEAWEHAPPL